MKTFVDFVLAEAKHPSCSESPKREEAQQEGGRNPGEVIQPASNPLQVNTQCPQRSKGRNRKDWRWRLGDKLKIKPGGVVLNIIKCQRQNWEASLKTSIVVFRPFGVGCVHSSITQFHRASLLITYNFTYFAAAAEYARRTRTNICSCCATPASSTTTWAAWSHH